jgi:4-aminobutyrate aminotransferase-like enzyme
VDGHQYVDLTAAFGVMSVGHANPRVVSAVTEQAQTLMHGMGDVHPPAIKVALLEALAELTPPGLDRAILGLNGSDAVESALKCAELVTGKSGVIAFEGGYHGLAGSALSVTARRAFRDPFAGRLAGQTTFLEFPTDAPAADRVLSEFRRKLTSPGSGMTPTGALILEPIQGRGGVRVPPSGFIAALAAVCREFDVLLIADEIFTGLGRTGTWFAMDHEGVVPDLLCIGKALGGGMPLSACVGGENTLGLWPASEGEALHTSTFLGHPVSCAAALASLRELQERCLEERAERLGSRVMTRLRDAGQVVRGRGLLIGIELDSGEAAMRVTQAALEAGVLLLPSGDTGQVLSLSPPLVIEEGTLDGAIDVVLECLSLA